jgi:glutamate/tyrosine decarboxylase-like PLP-dependent enzyme
MKLPKQGLPKETILEQLQTFQKQDLDWRSGRVFGFVYDPGESVRDLAKEAYGRFLTENGLDFTAFPSLLRLEREIVAMAANHLGGDSNVVGNFTSGGTESIILAVKAARDRARAQRPDILKPQMILPETAHAAFHKAAHYLDVQVVPVPVDPATFRAVPSVIREAITDRTILLMGSAPSYAHGVVDPIPEIGRIALEKGLPFHVDACVGGFMLPYFRRLGGKAPDFDFSVPGVTSISMDLHKYAYTPKGASVVLYRDPDYRRHQIFASAKWSGYAVVNAAVQSSKSGGPMAAAWAVLHYLGDDGYLEIARRQWEAARDLAAGIEAIPGLRLLGRPDFCMFSFTSDEVNVFLLADRMNARGWYIQPQLAFGASPANVHLSVSTANAEWVQAFLADLTQVADEIRGQRPDVPEDLLAAASGLDPAALSDHDVDGLLALAGISGEAPSPQAMAGINQIMNALDPALRERLLVAFANRIFRG